MREIDVGRGTENGEAKFAAVFGLLTKKHRVGPLPPPPSARGLSIVKYIVRVPIMHDPSEDPANIGRVFRGLHAFLHLQENDQNTVHLNSKRSKTM